MRQRIRVVSEVIGGGRSLRFEGGFLCGVLGEDQAITAGWRVGDRVKLEESLKQPEGYDLVLEHDPEQRATVMSLR